MRTFVIIIFILVVLETGIKIMYASGEHPREVSHTFGDDLINLFIFIGISAWAGCLLF